MNSKHLTWPFVGILLTILAACAEPEPPTEQGFAGLGAATEGFAEMAPDGELRFPDDHDMHPDFRIEWWYVTANLEDERGREYGVQWTLFRQALTPPEEVGEAREPSTWQDGQVWMAHAALTTVDDHVHAERFGRSGGGQAGVRTEPVYEAWLDHWSLRHVTPPGMAEPATEDPFSHLAVRADDDKFAFELALQTDQPLVPQGESGFSVKSERGQASWYYSQPFYRANGTLTLGNGEVAQVAGDAWLDREWSSQPLAPEQIGWDWFSLSLNTGERVMLFRLRERDDPDSYFAGTWISPDGDATPLSPSQIEMTPQTRHRVAGRDVPVEWSLAVPDFGLDIQTRAMNPDAWMDATVPYWEGPIDFDGSHQGRGYLEMTGY